MRRMDREGDSPRQSGYVGFSAAVVIGARIVRHVRSRGAEQRLSEPQRSRAERIFINNFGRSLQLTSVCKLSFSCSTDDNEY